MDVVNIEPKNIYLENNIVTAIQDWLMSQSHYNIIIGRKSQKSVFLFEEKNWCE